jgi:hypothetical protein
MARGTQAPPRSCPKETGLWSVPCPMASNARRQKIANWHIGSFPDRAASVMTPDRMSPGRVPYLLGDFSADVR